MPAGRDVGHGFRPKHHVLERLEVPAHVPGPGPGFVPVRQAPPQTGDCVGNEHALASLVTPPVNATFTRPRRGRGSGFPQAPCATRQARYLARDGRC